MERIKVLFVCVQNAARSQMAEAFLNQLAGDQFEAESAGLEPGTMNTVVVDVMKESGIDISGNSTKSVFNFFKEGRKFNFVISVCNQANAERCPIFPGITKRLNWSFEDPSTFIGDHDEILHRTRMVRDAIKTKVQAFIKTHHQYFYSFEISKA